MINFFFPFIFLSIISLIVSVNFRIDLNKSFLISILSIPLFIFFVGNFLSLNFSIYLMIFISFLYLLINQNFKKIIAPNLLKKIFWYFIIYILIILYSSNLFLHKYDEFSEYGIISKLIFYEGELMNNITIISAKGSPHKINIMGYLNYFFLKTSLSEFKEQFLYIAQNTLSIILIINLLEFITGNLKKISYFIVLFFLCFILSTGFDKIYLDTTAALLITLTILFQFHEKNKIKYLIIFISLIFLFSLKTSASIMFLGISFLFILYYILEKKFKIVIFYLFIIFSSFVIENLYLKDFYIKNYVDKSYDKENKKKEKIKLDNISYSINYNKKLNIIKDFNITNTKSKFHYLILEKNYLDLTQKGIYHSSTFLIFNKIFKILNLKLKLIEIPLTLFFWIVLLFIIIKFINIKNKSKLYLFVSSYVLFILSYWIIILYWAWSNQLINDDFSIEVSWQRHLGTIILGILLYLTNLLCQKNKMDLKQTLIIFIFICIIAKPNSIRSFLPIELILKDYFWSKKYEQRLNLKELAKFINNHSENYSTIIFSNKTKDPYVFPILNYELINKNLINMNIYNFENRILDDEYIFKNLFIKEREVYILIDASNSEFVTKYENSKKISITFIKDFNENFLFYKIKLI